MLMTILTHTIAFSVGALAVFVLVHKKPAVAEAAANSLAGKVDEAKEILKDLNKK